MDSLFLTRVQSNMTSSLIKDQKRALGKRRRNDILRSEVFSIKGLEDKNFEAKANSEQMGKMSDYQQKQQEYERQLQELERKADTSDGVIKYNIKRIEAEQNRMGMRLMKAAVLGREAIVDRIRAESFAKIISYRKTILGHCDSLSRLGRDQKKELQLEQAAYDRVTNRLNLRILATVALDRVRAEREETDRRGRGADAGLIREFFDADYSEQALKAEYVIQNLDTCMHNIELIRRMKTILAERREEIMPEAYAFVERKLEAVREYVNVVESVLWKYGLAIDDATLRVRKINENDVNFAKRRQAYHRNGALRFSLGARRYKHLEEGAGLAVGGQQANPVQTRVEARLSALETELGIRDFIEGDMRVMRSGSRSVERAIRIGPRGLIRASGDKAQGKMEDRLVKLRILKIFHGLRERLRAGSAADEETFRTLEPVLEAYVCTNRVIYENRNEAEEKEAAAFTALKEALIHMQQREVNECGRCAEILLGLLSEESSGYLDVPPGQIQVVEDDCITLGRRKHPVLSHMRTYRDCTNMPLFTHRPNIKDIEQGGLGDCYLLAGLLSVVDQNAEEIMNIMKDNGDGTVTVCFKKETGVGRQKRYTPCYVTVRKTVPVFRVIGGDVYSSGALWVKLMEKAYVASGLHILRRVNAERKGRSEAPLTARQLGASIAQGNYRVDYDDIAGGISGDFMSLLLGKESQRHDLARNKMAVAADRIGKLLPPINEPAWNQDPARRFGNDSADSIVYEFLTKAFSLAAQIFLDLKKPADDDPDHDALMRVYKTDELSIQDYVRSCMLHLDIAATVARETGTEFLKLGSEDKIRQWYGKLKTMFSHYIDWKQHGGQAARQSREDRIIDNVGKNYMATEAGDCFSRISLKEFEYTMDILQERHLALFRRNKTGGQGAGSGAPAQMQRSYYTTEDYELYEDISRALRSGSYIAFGTRKFSGKKTGLNGESESGGIVGTHAYSVINTSIRTIGGEPRIFFVVMNPWAEKGVVYDVGADGIRERAIRGKSQGEREEGVFLLELKRFAEVVRHWDAVPA